MPLFRFSSAKRDLSRSSEFKFHQASFGEAYVRTVATPMQLSLLSNPQQWIFSQQLKKSCFSTAKPYSPLILVRRRSVHAAMDGHADTCLPPPSPTICHRLQHALNVTSKWIVSAIAAIVVIVWRDQYHVLWAITGAVLNAASSKLLKKFFNQERPLSAVGLKEDSGMPSSHAQSLGFLSLYAAFGVVLQLGTNILGLASASLVLFCGNYLAWLRIAQGLHTHLQVTAGVGFGYSMAVLWIVLWCFCVEEVVASSTVYQKLLIGASGLSILFFILLAVRKWRLGDA